MVNLENREIIERILQDQKINRTYFYAIFFCDDL